MSLSVRLFRLRWLVLLACLTLLPAAELVAASPAASGVYSSGSYRGRILSELFRHRQRQTRPLAALSLAPVRAPRADIGSIAIIEESNGVVIRPNPFDLDGASVAFIPSGESFQITSGPLGFDQAARDTGVPVSLADDDSERLQLPFAFPFFGKSYQSVYMQSDGNLTFEEPEARTSERSLSRAISGPPRIAPLFSDLDPSRTGAAPSWHAASDRVVFTWADVPLFSFFGIGARQTFQATLHRDGRIEFHYQSITLNDAVVGIMPGRLEGENTPADLSAGSFQAPRGALAEIFSSSTDLDIFAVAQRFYQNHDDNHDYLVLFNTTGLSPGPGTFAFEVNVRNDVLGIGDLLLQDPVFDFGADFGSPRRLSSFLNMGPLSNYPEDPTTKIPLLGENDTLSVMGQEAGHRFLVYVRFIDPASGLPSTALLGRDDAHWSFFFNSDASVLEGNRIEDLGVGVSPRFRTVEAVTRYSAFDQYLMGLRSPEEVPPSFLVINPSISFPDSRPPRVGTSFDGQRKEVAVESIVAAEGERVPPASVAQKDFSYAFALLVREGETPAAADLAKLERIRTQWEQFFDRAVDGRGTANTSLTKMLHLSTWPAAGVLAGTSGEATVEIAARRDTDLDVLLSSDSSAITVPSVVTIPAGAVRVSFALAGNRPGVASLSARANSPGYETARTFVQVGDDAAALIVQVASGNNQVGGLGDLLAQPVTLEVRDSNRLPYSGVAISVTASGDGAVSPGRAITDSQGRVTLQWRLASSGTLHTLSAVLEAAPSVRITAQARAAGPRPSLPLAGIVNAASFNTGASAANVAVSPGGLLSIFGSGLAIETAQAASFPLPRVLAGTTVLINGASVPLLFVSPGQINLQAPFDLLGPTASLSVTTPAGSSEPLSVPVGAVQPGVFFNPISGLGAILYNDDALPISVRPARPGDFIQIFATGLGAVAPAIREGVAAAPSPLAVTVGTPRVLIGGVEAPVIFSGLAPTFAGLYQINVQIPLSPELPSGRQPLVVLLNGLSSNEVFLDLE